MSIKTQIKDLCSEKPLLRQLLNAAIRVKKSCKRPLKVNFNSLKCGVKIEDFSTDSKTDVVHYWSEHTVNSTPFKSKEESLHYLQWRSAQYPFFHDLMGIWGDHTGEVVVDYGCGPGNDTVGFLAHSNAKQIIGIDVSPTALQLASHRLAYHSDADLSRIRLIRVPEAPPRIPLEDNSVDTVYCEGVLQHTSDPLAILNEFSRILKVGGRADIMVYNRNSLWMHLYVAYKKKILERRYASFNDEEAFARTTDGENCPLARCYRPDEFLAMAEYAGFIGEYAGGYYFIDELEWFKKHCQNALKEPRLPREHREFLQALTFDKNGFPLYNGLHAGVGGVFHLKKEAVLR